MKKLLHLAFILAIGTTSCFGALNTPEEELLQACWRGNESEVTRLLLLSDQIDVNCKDSEDNTPLIAACQKGHTDIANSLIKAGANVNIQNTGGNPTNRG